MEPAVWVPAAGGVLSAFILVGTAVLIWGLNRRMKVSERLVKAEVNQANLEKGQANLEAGQARLEASQAKLEAGQASLQEGLTKLETGQDEIRRLLSSQGSSTVENP